tara:strand:- start:202414 stop:203280 length:867 start_codon:yes stop_codon:yes gene_type:complete
MFPSPSDILYFMEVAKTLNISRASERLGISQPSLSLAMQRLENIVGVELLIRNKQGVTLTKAGQQLFAQSGEFIQFWENVKSKTTASMSEVGGTYTIGCHASIAMHYLSKFLPKLMLEHPKLDIKIKHDLSRNITEEVISLKIDIGLVVNPVAHPDLIITPLNKGEVTLWTRAENPTKLQDFGEDISVLICDPNLIRSQIFMDQMKQNNITINRTIFSTDLDVIAELVSQGGGIGILPAHIAARAQNTLCRVKDAPVFYDDHCLIYRIENKNVKSIQVIKRAIKNIEP